MLEAIKLSLRITSNEFDDEITNLISACEGDLETSGVASSYFDKPLCKQAITLYCKAFFGFDNPDAEKYNQAYEHIKKKIAISYRKTESE